MLFVDSRYWGLAEKEVPKKGWEVKRVGTSGGSGRSAVTGGWVDYVVEVRQNIARQSLTPQELPDGSKVGIDPKLISNS